MQKSFDVRSKRIPSIRTAFLKKMSFLLECSSNFEKLAKLFIPADSDCIRVQCDVVCLQRSPDWCRRGKYSYIEEVWERILVAFYRSPRAKCWTIAASFGKWPSKCTYSCIYTGVVVDKPRWAGIGVDKVDGDSRRGHHTDRSLALNDEYTVGASCSVEWRSRIVTK